jgi:hypothetical protein
MGKKKQPSCPLCDAPGPLVPTVEGFDACRDCADGLRAYQRHAQPCRNDGLTLDELHRFAGRWDRYPVPEREFADAE